MPRIPLSKEEGKKNIDKAIEQYWEEVLKRMPPDKREEFLKELQAGRKIVVPQPPRE